MINEFLYSQINRTKHTLSNRYYFINQNKPMNKISTQKLEQKHSRASQKKKKKQDQTKTHFIFSVCTIRIRI